MFEGYGMMCLELTNKWCCLSALKHTIVLHRDVQMLSIVKEKYCLPKKKNTAPPQSPWVFWGRCDWIMEELPPWAWVLPWTSLVLSYQIKGTPLFPTAYLFTGGVQRLWSLLLLESPIVALPLLLARVRAVFYLAVSLGLHVSVSASSPEDSGGSHGYFGRLCMS